MLTKDNIVVLKQATSASFHILKDTQGEITLRKEVPDWDGNEVFVSWYVPGRIINYTAGAKAEKAIATCISASYDERWKALVHFVRPGDSLELEFLADNSTPVLREKGLVCDEVRVMVRRKGKRFAFLLDYRITPVHSSARMVTCEPISEKVS